MKKIFYVLALAVSMVLASCTSAGKLELAVKAVSAECPIVLDETITIVDVAIEENNVVYKCVIDEQAFEVNVSDLDDPDVKKAMKLAIWNDLKQQSDDEDVNELFELCKDADYNIVYRLTGSLTDYSIDLTIYAHEL